MMMMTITTTTTTLKRKIITVAHKKSSQQHIIIIMTFKTGHGGETGRDSLFPLFNIIRITYLINKIYTVVGTTALIIFVYERIMF